MNTLRPTVVLDPTDLDTRFVNEADHDKTAHDALGLSHDSLADVSINDHHNESHAVASHSDVTISGPQVEALLMFGSDNKAYVPCQYWETAMPGKIRAYSTYITNVDATDTTVLFSLPKPTVMGALSLHIDSLQVGLRDADAGDYLTQIIVLGMTDHDSQTEILNDPDDYTSPATVPYALGDIDCSTYVSIKVLLSLFCTDAGQVDISFVRLQCWYE